jgi:hypothetical protein
VAMYKKARQLQLSVMERGKQNACTGAGRGARKMPALKAGL